MYNLKNRICNLTLPQSQYHWVRLPISYKVSVSILSVGVADLEGSSGGLSLFWLFDDGWGHDKEDKFSWHKRDGQVYKTGDESKNQDHTITGKYWNEWARTTRWAAWRKRSETEKACWPRQFTTMAEMINLFLQQMDCDQYGWKKEVWGSLQ